MKLTMKWATPTLFAAAALAFSACADPVNPNVTGGCPPGGGGSEPTTSAATGATSSASTGASTGTGSTEAPTPGGMTSGKDGNTFDHFNDPGASGQKDPFQILKERAEEGEILGYGPGGV